VLRRAVELGVTLIDTADAYGPEIAERLIGEALAPYPPGVVIATKGGITRQGPAKTEYVGRAGYLIQCVEMSLRRLKLERIDLYQLHRIDPRTPLEESLGALKRMQEQGKIRHIGLSEVTPAEIEDAEKIVPSSLSRIDTVWPTAVTRKRSTIASSAASPSCPGIPSPAASCSSPTTPPRRNWPHRRPPLGHVAQLSLAWLLQRSPVMLPIPGTSKGRASRRKHRRG
jgi:pyridoxine 4-dehydrogenase